MATEREELPSDLKPVNYDLRLFDVDFKEFTYKGVVVIDYKFVSATDKVVLNYRSGLTLDKASAKVGEKVIDVTNISYNEAKEEVTLELSDKIEKDALVEIEFSALIQDNMAGFYRSTYQQDGQEKVMASTQFESTDARRAFPCADYPNLKATFDVSIEITAELGALSNMPVKSEETNGSKKTIVFERTPIMSTYLLAWAVGEFEYIESFTEKHYNGAPLPVRVYTTPGLKEQGQLALGAATKILDYFSDVFGVDYALPKCDLLAVHAFTHGAMENWGLITYRTTAVLFDEKTSDPFYKLRVVYVVAHELAHQWFGNLVTMDWWSELWLNEGFATWVGWLAVDYLHPEWDVFSRFVSDVLQPALQLDSLRGSHPIEVPVKTGAEIDQIFDSISYLKGASSIRMLSTRLGVETFLKGVAKYLQTHKFGNAKTTDLWAAVGEVAGVDVNSIMYHWTRSIGFPVVNVVETEDGDVKVRQDRFLSSGGVTLEENKTEWWVPLAITGADVSVESLNGRDAVLQGLAKNNFFKFNKDSVGVYRVNYTEERLNKIGDHPDKLSIRDKIGLVGDAAACASACIGSTTGLLSLIHKLGSSGESSFFVWNEMVTRLRSIRAAWSQNDSVRKQLDQFSAKLIEPVLKQFTWETTTDDYVWIQFRALIIAFALDIGVESSISEAKERFFKLVDGDSSAVHPSLQLAAMCATISNSTGAELEKAYSYAKKEMANSATVDGRERACVAAGRVQEPELIQQSLNAFLEGAVPSQDVHTIVNSLAANRAARAATWDFFKTKWDDIVAKYGSNLIIFERLVRLVTSHFSTKQEYEDVVKFFEGKDLTGYDRGVEQSKDMIKVRYQWVEKDTEAVDSWFKSN